MSLVVESNTTANVDMRAGARTVRTASGIVLCFISLKITLKVFFFFP